MEIAQFLPARHVVREKRLSNAVEAIIRQAIDQHYAQRTRPSLNSLVGEIAGRCRAVNLRPPSAKAIKARVRTRDQVWLMRRREGWSKARSLRLLTGADPGAQAPWERVQIDSTPCDIRLVREHDRTVIGRPNITFAIDIYSRTILGFSVSLQSASTVTVATCLAQACLPKQDWLARHDLAGVHWPVWGKPFILEYDQGPEHEAKGIQRGLRLHGIKSKVRTKGHPEHHGTIERLIGTMMRRVHERRGTTFSNINERGDTEPDRLACLGLPELEQIIALEIDTYNHSTHDGIADRPLDRYLAYYRRPDLPDERRIPPLLSAGRLLLDFLPYEHRRLTRAGLHLFRVDYSSRDLLPMWHRQNQTPVERVVVYDPRSLATVWVVDDVSSEYIAVPYRIPRPDMTLAESEAARRRRQALKAADRTEARLFENVLQIRTIEERGRTTTSRMKAERSRQARRSASRSTIPAGASSTHPTAAQPSVAIIPPAVIEPFADVEDL
jgi:putative transposase